MNNNGKIVALDVQGVKKIVKTEEGQLEILKNINLKVHLGESVALVGPSGSGKSTLLSLLAGLDIANEGEIFLMGKDLSSCTEDERARIRKDFVSFIFQSFQLLSHLNAKQNVEFGLEIQGRQDDEKVNWALEQVGLAHRAKHYPKTLSGGEQQRVAMARALAVTPKVMFADEPTGSLDQVTGHKVENLLFDLSKKQGCALVVVTHDMRLAQKADRIVRIDQGILVEQ